MRVDVAPNPELIHHRRERPDLRADAVHAPEASRHQQPHGCRNAQLGRITRFVFKKDRVDRCRCIQASNRPTNLWVGAAHVVVACGAECLTTNRWGDGIRAIGDLHGIPPSLTTNPLFGRRALDHGHTSCLTHPPLDPQRSDHHGAGFRKHPARGAQASTNPHAVKAGRASHPRTSWPTTPQARRRRSRCWKC